MIRNRKTIFALWVLHSDEELRQCPLCGAKIELALRTGTQEDREVALNSLDDNTYNAIFVLELARDEEELRSILQRLDSVLVSRIVGARSLPVEENEALFLYFAQRVVNNCTGTLRVVAEALLTLTKRAVKPSSKVVNTLFECGFIKPEVFYLNYCWLKDSVSERKRANMFLQVFEEYFRRDFELTRNQKLFIQRELSVTFRFAVDSGYKTMGQWISSFSTVPVGNGNNWYFLRELVESGLLLPYCRTLAINPLDTHEYEKFALLSKEQQFYSIDYYLSQFKTKAALDTVLEHYELLDYHENLDRPIASQTLQEWLRLGCLSIGDLPLSKVRNLVQNNLNGEMFKLLSDADYDMVAVFGINSWYYNLDSVFNNDLSAADKRALISMLIDQVYNSQSSSSFISFVCCLLHYKELLNLYEYSMLWSVVEFFVNDFAGDIGRVKVTSLRKIYMRSEDFLEWQEIESEKQEEERRLKREAMLQQNKTDAENNCASIVDFEALLQYVENDAFRGIYDNESINTVWAVVYGRAHDLFPDAKFSKEMFDLYYKMYSKGIINFVELTDVFRKSDTREVDYADIVE